MTRAAVASLLAGVFGALLLMGANAQSPSATLPPSQANEAIKSGADENKSASLTGKLFFSDRERSQLDQIRDRPKGAAQQIENADMRSIINGYVKRADGVAYVWIDGDYKLLSDVRLASRVRANSVGMDIANITTNESREKTAPAVYVDIKKRPVVKQRRANQLSDTGKLPKR